MSDFYQNRAVYTGSNIGGTLIQAKGSVGGYRHVFVKLQNSNKSEQTFPTTGGILANPFKGRAKIFAGDLFEFDPGITGDKGATVKLLKTYELAADASSTTVLLVRDGFHHIPFVGDTIMVAPATISGTGSPVTVTAVESTTDATAGEVWKLTTSAAVTGSKGAVLVEADATTKKAVVTNPNAVALCDYDFLYNPAASDVDFDGARYLMNPGLGSECGYMYEAKMSPLPACVKALNTSKVDGWFKL